MYLSEYVVLTYKGLAKNRDSWMAITCFLWLTHTWGIKSLLDSEPFVILECHLVSLMSLGGYITTVLYSRETGILPAPYSRCLSKFTHSHSFPWLNASQYEWLSFPHLWRPVPFLEHVLCAKVCAECFAYVVLSNPQSDDVKRFMDQNSFKTCEKNTTDFKKKQI